MGKTSKPLTIIVVGEPTSWFEWEKLEAQGHEIIKVDPGKIYADLEPKLTKADIIMGPTAWRMDGDLRKYLPLALKEARMIRYPSEKRFDKKVRDSSGSDIDAVLTPGSEPETD